MSDKTIKIIVATHKKYQMPEGDLYLPIHSGHNGKEDLGYIGDDTGDNISDQNWYFNEATAIYWAWKNLDYDYIGISHYRRHFTVKKKPSVLIKGKWNCVLTHDEADGLIKDNDIVVSKKRWYLFETNKSHYCNGHNPKELDLMRDIISKKYPDYIAAFDEMNSRRWAHMFNMFIMSREKYCSFCEWWFDVLFEFKNRIDMTGYPKSEQRAFIDERMMDVWLIKNEYEYKEIPVMYMENQNWFKKIALFFARKFFIHHNV